MGRIVVSEFLSIDGVMEAPGGEPGYRHTGWVAGYQDEAQILHKLEEVLAHEALLLGRKTYESFAEAWPDYEGEFADKMNHMPKFVATATLSNLQWNNSTVLTGDTIAAISRLKPEIAGDILVNGSRTLVSALRQHNLVDEYRLMVFPIVLGSGMRLFDESVDATALSLAGVRSFANGTVELTYRAIPSEGDPK